MFLNAKNGNIRFNGHDCDYISFGSGDDVLIMLPGVGDGFKTAKGVAVPFSVMYRCFAKDFRVFVFSRRNRMLKGFTTKNMADDIAAIKDKLEIDSAHVFGVSQGGMIAQQMVILHPDRVKSLVLAVTASKPNDIMRDTGAYLERGRKLNKLLALVKPKDYTRFRILCESCLEHDAYDELDKISCPVFIIGADSDRVLGGEASEELAERIPGAELYMYEGYSHGVYEQAKDFNKRVLDNLTKQK